MSSGDFKSKGELRRLAEQKAIKIDKNPVSVDELINMLLFTSLVVTVGKRKVFRITPQ